MDSMICQNRDHFLPDNIQSVHLEFLDPDLNRVPFQVFVPLIEYVSLMFPKARDCQLFSFEIVFLIWAWNILVLVRSGTRIVRADSAMRSRSSSGTDAMPFSATAGLSLLASFCTIFRLLGALEKDHPDGRPQKSGLIAGILGSFRNQRKLSVLIAFDQDFRSLQYF